MHDSLDIRTPKPGDILMINLYVVRTFIAILVDLNDAESLMQARQIGKAHGVIKTLKPSAQ